MEFAVRSSRFKLAVGVGLMVALALAGAAKTRAQGGGGVQLRLSADQTRVEVGEPFSVVLELRNGGRDLNALPTQPDFGDLQVRSGPNHTLRTTIINGRMSVQQSYQWELMAPRAGEYTIGPSTLSVGSGQVESNTLRIEVTAAAASPELPASLQGKPILPPVVGDPKLRDALRGNLFLYPEIETTMPYVSQPVVARYVLYRNPQLNITAFRETMPEYEGLLNVELYHANSIRWRQTEVDGEQYESARMLDVALVPTQAGPLTVPGYAMSGRLLLDRRDRMGIPSDPFGLMDDWFEDPFVPGVGVDLPTPPVELQVRPLPEAGKPAGFNGTVGNYALRAEVDRTTATLDEFITLKLTLEGHGAVELAAAPTLPGDLFEVVGQHSKATVDPSETGLGGAKEFEYVLRPRRSGRLAVPAVSYAVFDPWAERYKVLQTKPVSLLIAPGSGPPPTKVAETRPAPAEPSNPLSAIEALPLKPITRLRTRTPAVLMESTWLWVALAGALGLALAAGWRRRAQLRRDPMQTRRQGAWRRFERRIRALQQQAAQARRPAEAARELEGAVRHCIADVHGVSADGLTRQEITRLLRERAMPAERIERICGLLDECVALRYAPAEGEPQPVERWSEELSHLLKDGLAQ